MHSRRLLFLLFFNFLHAQKPPVSLDAAAERPDPLPEVHWSADGGRMLWLSGGNYVVYDTASRSRREVLEQQALSDSAATAAAAEAFGWVNRGVREQDIQWLGAGREALLRVKGDLFLVDIATGKWRQLTHTGATEGDPQVSPDSRRVAYLLDHDLYAQDIEGGRLTRLTQGGSSTLRNGEPDWVYPEELALGSAYWWSPDSRRIAYLQFDLGRQMIYPHGDLTGVRPVFEPQRYPQAGTPNAAVRLGVVGASGGRTKWLDTGAAADSLIARVTWLPGGSALGVHLLNRVQNRLDIVIVDAGGGKPKTLVSETAKAWINLEDDFRFFSADAMLRGSDRDGWRHLYLEPKGTPITRGQWQVTELACVDDRTRQAWFVATTASAVERHLYRVSLDGGEPVALTSAPGTHQISMAPGCGHYTDRHSSLTQPDKLTLHTAAGEQIAVVAEQKAPEHELLPVELLRFRGPDGAMFDARLTRPAGFDGSKKYPAVVMVYGGPHSQAVQNKWRGADWDQALAQRGFVVWQMDNRGSAGRGHVWEAPLYRRFGQRELADQLEGVRHLISLGFTDPERVGIHGWSYGGFMTLYSMLHSPATFRAGISGAPVTDWRNYDTIYTERYLGLPAENEEGYKSSSPVHFAERLQGRLMLAHNFEDDNVLFQHTLRMSASLQKAGKQFDLLLYPQKTHGVTGTQLRRHMLEAMTAFFERNLK